ncbi:MAG: hypothetical protein K9G33_10410 [Sneathiella sp.]|nr:hypothetical protein [Sneathiella sp.]
MDNGAATHRVLFAAHAYRSSKSCGPAREIGAIRPREDGLGYELCLDVPQSEIPWRDGELFITKVE